MILLKVIWILNHIFSILIVPSSKYQKLLNRENRILPYCYCFLYRRIFLVLSSFPLFYCMGHLFHEFFMFLKHYYFRCIVRCFFSRLVFTFLFLLLFFLFCFLFFSNRLCFYNQLSLTHSESQKNINPSHATRLFHTPENTRKSEVSFCFRGYRKWQVAWNRLIQSIKLGHMWLVSEKYVGF